MSYWQPRNSLPLHTRTGASRAHFVPVFRASMFVSVFRGLGGKMSALVHVLIPLCLCVVLVNTGAFDAVPVDLSYDDYAEQRVARAPAFLAMPCNCAVNLGYVIVGVYWLLWSAEGRGAAYAKDVFALMALIYGPLQWTRLATLRRAPAVLDQWMTLPMFAWVPVWCGAIARGWSARAALCAELCSVLSYAAVLVCARGFELALGAHVVAAVLHAARLQRAQGDRASLRHLGLGALCCAGFVLLKVLDHELARFWVFRRLTGHFWSKVCDVMQIHFGLCFLTHCEQNARKRRA